jgi:hypothetical protein
MPAAPAKADPAQFLSNKKRKPAMNSLAYLGARMKEKSSFVGAAFFILSVLQFSASPALVNAAVAAVCGLIAILVPEGASAQPPTGG